MSDLINQIRYAQVRAGEEAVLESLKRMGVQPVPMAPPYHATPVEEFHKAFGHPVELSPTVPTLNQRLLRVKLLAEELSEFAAAAGIELDVHFNGEKYEIEVVDSGGPVDLVECADGLGDIRYLANGGDLIFGFPGWRVDAEIHRSNMSKLGADGLPVRREDGKTLKGPNYSPPNLARVLGLE